MFGTSTTGADVYLVAQGVLAANENGNGEHAEQAKDNLYRLQFEDGEWTRTYIATLSSEDNPEWEGNRLADSAYLTARVSPNGRYLAFMSAADFTGYDNVDANPQAKGAHDEEVFLYDATAKSLRCVSCNPSGARPKGVLDQSEAGEGDGLLVDRRRTWLGRYLGGNIPGWTAESLVSALFQSRYLSDSGRLYFNSPDELVPAAKNDEENVYEYEPTGVGSCESATGGCVALLTPASSERESAFIEATPSGSNVFFITGSQLLPQDTDTAADIYDARTCTESSPCQSIPTPLSGGCGETETCRPAQPQQSIPGGPAGSATLTGPGNTPSSGSQTTGPGRQTHQSQDQATEQSPKAHTRTEGLQETTLQAQAKSVRSPRPQALRQKDDADRSEQEEGGGTMRHLCLSVMVVGTGKPVRRVLLVAIAATVVSLAVECHAGVRASAVVADQRGNGAHEPAPRRRRRGARGVQQPWRRASRRRKDTGLHRQRSAVGVERDRDRRLDQWWVPG